MMIARITTTIGTTMAAVLLSGATAAAGIDDVVGDVDAGGVGTTMAAVLLSGATAAAGSDDVVGDVDAGGEPAETTTTSS